MKNGVQVDAIYTDFSKAFDKVSHRLLLSKLAKLEFSGSFLAWIGSYLTGREQYVKASGSQSRRFPVFLLLATVVAGNSDFANAQAALDVFAIGASTAGCSSTWGSVRA
jgi:hypothetical protein